jgi:hypothetical protein
VPYDADTSANLHRQAPCRRQVPHDDGRCLMVPVAVTAGDKIEGYARGLPVGACRRIGRGCIRGRKGRVAVEAGGWCSRSELGTNRLVSAYGQSTCGLSNCIAYGIGGTTSELLVV